LDFWFENKPSGNPGVRPQDCPLQFEKWFKHVGRKRSILIAEVKQVGHCVHESRGSVAASDAKNAIAACDATQKRDRSLRCDEKRDRSLRCDAKTRSELVLFGRT
jgi:hypothetical protein